VERATATGSVYFQWRVKSVAVSISQPKETHSTVSYNTSSTEIEYATGKKTANVLSTAGWIGPSSGAFEFKSKDLGLGVSATRVEVEGVEKLSKNYLTNGGCDGIQCEEEEHEKVTYASFKGGLPNGDDKLRVAARDPMEGTWSSEHGEGEVTLKVDSTPPHGITLTGLSTVGEELQLGEVEAHVKVEATDGEGSTPSSGIAAIELYIDGHETGTAEGSCPVGPCTASGEWSLNGAELGAGEHTLTVKAIDNASNIATKEYQLSVYHASPVAMGPGSVNPESGDFALGATDVNLSGGLGVLSVSRHYDSRNLQEGAEGPLGPQWSVSLGSLASLEVLPNKGVMVVGPEGLTYFTPKEGGGFEAPIGDTTLKLEYDTEYEGKEPAYLLKNETQLATTVFKLPTGAKSWMPTISKGSVATDTMTDEYKSVEVGEGKVIVEPTLELAPHPAATCGGEELEKLEIAATGCRALKFVYAEKTKENIGEDQSEWGEYKNRLMEVIAFAYNPATNAMAKTPVAKYEYDKQGRLRAEWNPEISPALKTTYGYDAEGHVTALTSPGQQPWAFTYGTLTGDASTGRMLKVTQARPRAGASEHEILTTLKEQTNVLETQEMPKVTSGTPIVGVRISVSTGKWYGAPVAYGYQWERCKSGLLECAPILGATNATYTPQTGDAGYVLAAHVTATNGNGSVTVTTAESSVIGATDLVEYPLPSGSAPAGIALGKEGDVWFTNLKEKIGKMTPSGTVTEYKVLKTTGGPEHIALGSEGDLWFTNPASETIGKITTSGTITEYALPSGSWPSGIALGSEGDLWFSDSQTSKIGKITTSGTITEYALPSGSKPKGIADGPEKESALWFTDYGTSKIGKITTSGTITEYALPTGSDPEGIATAPEKEKALWFTDYGTSKIGKITTSGTITEYSLPSGSDPNSIATGPTKENDLWFTDYTNGKIGKITTSGTITEYTATKGHFLDDIASGSAGEMWFTVSDSMIGKMVAKPAEGENIKPAPGTTIEYNVALSGAGLPNLSEGEVAKWGQKDDPRYATAIFPPDEPQDWPATSYKRATISYLDDQARTVNVAAPSGAIGTREYNEANEVTRALSADNRAAAMNEGCVSVSKKECRSAEVSELLDTKSSYNTEGQLNESWGPQHKVKLAIGKEGKPDEEVLARNHIKYFYNEGAKEVEEKTKETYDLVTKTIDGAETASKEEFDKRTATTSYSGQGDLGWKLRAPTSETTEPSGLDLTTTTKYEEGSGNVIETEGPAAAGGDKVVPPAYAAEFGTVGSEAGELKEPRGTAIASNGDVDVLDTANNRIDEFSPAGTFIETFGWGVSDGKAEFETCKTNCKAGIAGSGNGQLKEPYAIAEDSKGNLLVADTGNDRVQVFNSKNEYASQFGKEGTAESQFKEPKGIAVAANGNIFVVDTVNNRVEKFNEKHEFVSAFGFGVSNEKAEFEICTSSCKAGIAGSGNGQLNTPLGIAVSAVGDVCVIDDANNRLEEFKENGEYLTKIGTSGTGAGQFKEPKGIAIEPGTGNLWVAETGNERLQELTSSGAYIATVGIKGTGNGQFEEPRGIAITSTGTMYVADVKNNRVQRWVQTISGNAGAHDIKTIYYTAKGEASAEECRGHIEWAGLPCETEPAAQPGVSGLPELPVTKISYNMWDQAEKTEEKFGTGAGTKIRTKTTTYEASGRPLTSEVTSTIDEEVPRVSDKYNTTSGELEEQSTKVGETTKTITSKYNTLGQLEAYTDATGNTATFEYETEKDARLIKVSDPKGNQKYIYNETTGTLSELVDSAAGTFKAEYDIAGRMTSESYPNGMTAYYTRNPAGDTTGIEYKKTVDCAKTCPEVWFSDSVVPSIHGEALSQASTLSEEPSYTYDAAGRLIQAQEIPAGEGCKTRIYAYDEDSNRTTEMTREPAAEGKCASEGGSTEWHTYDSANSLADPGVSYETFGDTTKLPAADAGGKEASEGLTSEYYVDGQVYKQEQGEQKLEYKLDPEERTLETVSTGKPVDSTVTSHYDAAGGAVAWTGEGSGETEKWTRNIPGIDGSLTATQKGEGKTGGGVVLLLHDLQGDVVGEAALSESETKLLKTYNSTEFGVPSGKGAPPKYAWLGASGLAGELPSGVITQDGVTYVPQTGRPLQTEGVAITLPENATPAFARTLAPWVIEGTAAAAHQRANAEEEEERIAKANQPPGETPIPVTCEEFGTCEGGGGEEQGGGGGGGGCSGISACAASVHGGFEQTSQSGNNGYGCSIWGSWGSGELLAGEIAGFGHWGCGATVPGFEMQIEAYGEGAPEFEGYEVMLGKPGHKITKRFPAGRGGVIEHTWKCPATGSWYHLWVWGRQLGSHGATQWSAAGWEERTGHCIKQGPVDMSPVGEGAEES
jgi:streptogramin lyase